MILEGYGTGPNMIRLIRNFWANTIMVCRASGYYGTPFQAGCGVAQGSILEEEEINHPTETFFAIFYVDDAYLAS